MPLMASMPSKIFKTISGIGLGKIPGMSSFYKFVWSQLGPKGVRLVEMNGFKMYVACCDWAVAPTMLFAHTWEPMETRIFKRHIEDGMTVVDAGAYIGYYSILASKLVGSRGKVYAFEPSPECLGLLYRNIQMNGCKNVQVVEKAIADKTGCTAFYLSSQNLSGSTMFKNYSTPPGRFQGLQIEVPTITLDEVIGDGSVDFIKMDIEGGEIKALSGMVKIIRNNPSLEMIIEVFLPGLAEVGSSLEEYIGSLQRHFQLHIIGECGLTGEVGLLDIQRAISKTKVINLFCQKRGLRLC